MSEITIDDFYPTTCVLCPDSSDTTEDHERHMSEVHNA
jgi:hypothetical protein